MIISPLSIPGAAIVTFTPYVDERGEFCRLFCLNELKDILGDRKIVQINRSVTRKSGTVRGMHFQNPPCAEMKLFQCTRGRVFDVVIDIRKDSPTYLSWAGVELSPDLRKMVIIPEGCAHGFQALTDDAEVLYFTTAFYAPDYEGGIRFDDPKIDIHWPLPERGVSERDMNHPLISDSFKDI
jgi:dTDP-4-dehydrorhamnose 3,5-epimerase